MNKTENENYINIAEASRRFQIPRRRLDKMKALGQLPGIVMVERFYVDVKKFQEYLDSGQINTTRRKK